MKKSVQKLINKMTETYQENIKKQKGSECVCPSCGTNFTKTTNSQKFCRSKSGSQCRDKYWNTVIETKRNNRTRISPASLTWMTLNYDRKTLREPSKSERFNPDDHEHPFSSDALGQWG